MKNNKTLFLTLKKKPFEVMVTGEKSKEYREVKVWVISRLFHKNGTPKEYEFIKFVNGFGAKMPYFICKFEGFFLDKSCSIRRTYSNGLCLEITEPVYVINCGEIVEKGNLK